MTYWKSWVNLGSFLLGAYWLWLVLSLLLTLELVGNGSLVLCQDISIAYTIRIFWASHTGVIGLVAVFLTLVESLVLLLLLELGVWDVLLVAILVDAAVTN